MYFRSSSKTEFAKLKSSSFSSRVYADTYEECVELFNYLVDEKVKWFLESWGSQERFNREVNIEKEKAMKDRF